MHGLINRALQRFAEDTLGFDLWAEVIQEAAPGLHGFEAMLEYEDSITKSVLQALAKKTEMSPEMLLEDLGTYIISHPNTGALRRLLRFGGDTYIDFLYSLDDLPDRVRLAVADLILPSLDLSEHTPGHFSLAVGPGLAGLGSVLLGMLRAIADDYGTLALVELVCENDEGARLSISVAEVSFAAGRKFDLAPVGEVVS